MAVEALGKGMYLSCNTRRNASLELRRGSSSAVELGRSRSGFLGRRLVVGSPRGKPLGSGNLGSISARVSRCSKTDVSSPRANVQIFHVGKGSSSSFYLFLSCCFLFLCLVLIWKIYSLTFFNQCSNFFFQCDCRCPFLLENL